MYRYFVSKTDTIYIDTSLHLKQAYKHNLLRRDIFGLFEYSNEGQMYQRLSRKAELDSDVFPRMGFTAKFFNYYQVDDMRYYHVATPFSELYFKTVMQQGQNLDATFAVNTS
ncbi:putative porin, partial [Arthrospira platensis SPKY1]|nr:putative porin [Arthrospira platensis SPKY1]